ncbi:hypothetical protein LWM68_40380 [Niabella sp. W65]|nr:hypothetical protein [Niabella sp. W65]MCH7368444.1 hypothetical protein [Niabella sp. W65]ULT44040.1 hypothetical protein KRR40_12080 [Niabella sp. I65]
MCSWALRSLLIEDDNRLILVDTGMGTNKVKNSSDIITCTEMTTWIKTWLHWVFTGMILQTFFNASPF